MQFNVNSPEHYLFDLCGVLGECCIELALDSSQRIGGALCPPAELFDGHGHDLERQQAQVIGEL